MRDKNPDTETPAPLASGKAFFPRWHRSTLRIDHDQRLKVEKPKGDPASAVAQQNKWNSCFFIVHLSWPCTSLGSLNLNLSTPPGEQTCDPIDQHQNLFAKVLIMTFDPWDVDDIKNLHPLGIFPASLYEKLRCPN